MHRRHSISEIYSTILTSSATDGRSETIDAPRLGTFAACEQIAPLGAHKPPFGTVERRWRRDADPLVVAGVSLHAATMIEQFRPHYLEEI